MGASLVTKTEYKAYISITNPNQDAQIDAIIPKVSELVKTYCRRTFVDYVSDAKIEVTKGGYGSTIWLSEFPILSITDVGYSEDYGQNYTSLVEYTDYVLDKESGGILNISTGDWASVINGYQITYTAGYENLPEDLKLAVFDMITYYLKNDMAVHSPKAPGTNSVQVEYITTAAFPAHIRRVLDLYKGSWD